MIQDKAIFTTAEEEAVYDPSIGAIFTDLE